MANSNEENLSNTDLSEIKSQLKQLCSQLAEIQPHLNQLTSLSEKVNRLEDNLMLVADVHRYDGLRRYLVEGNWFEADKETIRLILDIAGMAQEELSPDEIKQFPCNDLRVIDQLWSKYSNGRFGFSTQLRIYQELGGNLAATIEQNQQLIEKWGETARLAREQALETLQRTRLLPQCAPRRSSFPVVEFSLRLKDDQLFLKSPDHL